MPELTDLSVIRTLCEKYDFALSKGFGQNFIINPGLPPKIVDASGVDKNWGVLEIGPGIGVLTKELASRAAKVVSIEVDERLPPLLAETMAGVDNFLPSAPGSTARRRWTNTTTSTSGWLTSAS